MVGGTQKVHNFLVVFFVAKSINLDDFLGKKCEPSGAHFQENTLGAMGQGANMLTTLPVIWKGGQSSEWTWSFKMAFNLLIVTVEKSLIGHWLLACDVTSYKIDIAQLVCACLN